MGAGDDDIIGDLAAGGSGVDEVDVDDASEVLGNDAASALGEGSEGGTAGKTSVDEGAELRTGGGIALELERGAGGDGLSVGAGSHGEGRERREDQVAPLGAGGDEGRGEREDLLGRKEACRKAWGAAATLLATRMKVWWRASMVRMEPAVERMPASVRRGAAPRYAETPTFSRTAAVATMPCASAKPKLYWHGWTGWKPAWAMALLEQHDVLLLTLADADQVVDFLLCQAQVEEVALEGTWRILAGRRLPQATPMSTR